MVYDQEEARSAAERGDLERSVYVDLLHQAVHQIDVLTAALQQQRHLTCEHPTEPHDVFWWTDPTLIPADTAQPAKARVNSHTDVHMLLASAEVADPNVVAVMVGNLTDPAYIPCYVWERD